MIEGLRREHLVPVVDDATLAPSVPAPAEQPHRVGMCGTEEGFRSGGAPVDEEMVAVAVGEPEASDPERLAAIGGDDAAHPQVDPVAPERTEATGEAVDLEVTIHGCSAGTSWCEAGRSPALLELCERALEAGRDGAKVVVVSRCQGRVGLGGEALGEGEVRRCRGFHDGLRSAGTSGHDHQFWTRAAACHKAPHPLYLGSGGASGRFFRRLVRGDDLRLVRSNR